MYLPFEEIISQEMGTPCTSVHVDRVGGRESCRVVEGFFSPFLSFLLIFYFLFFGNCPGAVVLLLVVAATATIRAILNQRTNLLHE